MISITSESVWIIKDPAKTFRFQAGAGCRSLLLPPWETQTLRCHNNWSLNYSGKVRERGRLIHHLGEARRSQLAAVSSVALQGRHFEITMQSRRRSLPTSQWEPLVSLRAARFLCIRKETAALYFRVANWVVTKHLCHTKDNILFSIYQCVPSVFL